MGVDLLANIPIGIAAIVLTATKVPNVGRPTRSRSTGLGW